MGESTNQEIGKPLYYTPSLGEFHVGFEYEEKQLENDTDYIYEKQIFGVDISVDGPLIIEGDIIEKNIRVKYLDEEDIKALGFKPKDEKGVRMFRNDECKLILYKPSSQNPEDTYVMIVPDKPGQSFIARIYIKNKSELKRLLRQARIKV